MADLTEERVREIAREEAEKAKKVDIHKVAKELWELQKRNR